VSLPPDGRTRLRRPGFDNDGFGYFDALGSTVVTGPTFTNINDFREPMIESAAG
jgi:hydroxypyruvate reductase